MANIAAASAPRESGLRVVLTAWLILLAPFVALALFLLRQDPGVSPMVCRADVTLPGRVIDSRTASDIAGDHLVALCGDGNLYVLSEETEGRLVAKRLSTPWSAQDIRRVRLHLSDLNDDGLVDLTASVVRRHELPGERPARRTEPAAAVYTQHEQGFQLTSVGQPPKLSPSSDEPNLMLLDGRDCRLDPEATDGGLHYRTRVVELNSNRLVRVLRGAVLHVLDVDSDGQDDVLTEELVGEDLPLVHYRLYLAQGRRMVKVWDTELRQRIVRSGVVHVIDVADLNQDSRPDFIAAEPETGRVMVWSLSNRAR